MMRKGHDKGARPFWLAVTLAANLVAPGVVSPVAVALGAAVPPVFAGGKNGSPDMDLRWSNRRPSKGYPLAGHRGLTHRWWLAWIITALFGAVPVGISVSLCVPLRYAVVLLVIPSQWVSHLALDMWFGRLKLLGRSRGLGWTTGGPAEEGGTHALGVLTWVLAPLNVLAVLPVPFVIKLSLTASALFVWWFLMLRVQPWWSKRKERVDSRPHGH